VYKSLGVLRPLQNRA